MDDTASPRYLTVVYRIHSVGQEQAILQGAVHEAWSYGNAIAQRDALLKVADEHLRKLRETARYTPAHL